MKSDIIESIESVDSFHKNCLLLFDDIVSSIKEKTLTGNLLNLVGPEGNFSVWNTNMSEYHRVYVFKYEMQIRFVWMLVKTHDEKLQSNSTGFKEICHELNINSRYPLLMVAGLFKPKDSNRFMEQLNVRRNWVDNILLLKISDDIKKNINRTKPYEFEKIMSLKTLEGTDSWHCEESVFIIRDLVNIKNSDDVEEFVKLVISIDA